MKLSLELGKLNLKLSLKSSKFANDEDLSIHQISKHPTKYL